MDLSTSDHPAPRWANLALGVILVAGAALRLGGLQTQSLWNDELSSWGRSDHPDVATVIQRGALPDVHPPGFHLLLYAVERNLGDSEFWLRLPSAIFGIIAVFFMFLLGRKLFGWREGLIAAALLATLHFPVSYSQECRSYSALLCFTIISCNAWITLARSLAAGSWPRLGAGVGYVLSALAAAYLHYFGLLIVGLQGLALLIAALRRRSGLAKVVWIYAPVVLLYLPWAIGVLGHLKTAGISWIRPPDHVQLTEFNRHLYNRSGTLSVLAGLLYASPAVLRFIARRRGFEVARFFPSDPPGSRLVLAWLLVPVLATWLISVLWVPVFTFRNLIVVAPAAYLLLARCMTTLPLRPRFRLAVIAGFLAIGLFELFVTLQYYHRPHKQQFREAARWVAQRQEQTDPSVIIAYAHNKKYFDYYLEKNGSGKRVALIAGQAADIPRVEKFLAARRERFVWYLRGHRQPDERFMAYLQDRLRLVEHRPFIGADAWLFEFR